MRASGRLRRQGWRGVVAVAFAATAVLAVTVSRGAPAHVALISARHPSRAHGAHGASGAKRAIRAGIDSIEHGTFLDDEALEMMKARGTYYIPTLMAAQGLKERLSDGYLPPAVETKARAAMAALDATVRKAIARGVKIGVGTDAAVYPHGRNAANWSASWNWG